MTKGYNQYIKDVTSGKVVTCKLVKSAIARHVADLKKQNTESFPFIFNEALADRAIKALQLFKHTKGEFAKQHKYIELEPWEQFIVASLFGWVDQEGVRRFKRALIMMGRKQGKTTLAALIAIYLFFFDHEVGPQVYFAATKRAQAKIAWEEVERQIKSTRHLAERVKIYYSSSYIVDKNNSAAKIVPLARDSHREDGLDPSAAIVDEYHAHPDSHMLEVLESGMGARKQPLVLIISTAGTNFNGPCYFEAEHLSKMLSGSIPYIDHEFGLIYSLDPGDDWKEKKNWIKANPNLGVSISEKYLQEQVELAQSSPMKLSGVLTKNFNQWVHAKSAWVSVEDWRKCGLVNYTEEELKGRQCFAGMDLSGTTDLTAFVLSFPPLLSGEPWKHIFRFYLPNNLIQRREDRDRVPYGKWIKDGLIKATSGDVVDYDHVEHDIKELAKTYTIKEICFDPYHAQEIVNHLTSEGLAMVSVAQGYKGSAKFNPIFERKILAREIAHNNNPVIEWMLTCVETMSDYQGNVKFVKPQRNTAGKRIDGIVAMAMALGRGVQVTSSSDQRSKYETQGVVAVAWN